MKKITTLLALMLISLGGLFAQINLEHTFTSYSGVTSFMTSTHGIMYYSSDSTQVKVYNTDYSLYKTIPITSRPVGYSSYLEFVSDNLFDSDSGIEFFVTYSKSSFDGTNNSSTIIYKIIDEDGSVLKDLKQISFTGYGSMSSPTLINNGSTVKLQLTYLGSNDNLLDEIYSLPGKLPSGVTVLRSASLDQPEAYPNPAVQIINIPYILEVGETTSLKIYNQAGIQVEEKTIDSAFKQIRLDVSRYIPGLYLFKYKDMSGRFIVK